MHNNDTSGNPAAKAASVPAQPSGALVTGGGFAPRGLGTVTTARASTGAEWILPPLVTSDLRSSRVTGTRRLALVAGEQRLDAATIEAVIAAAADPRRDFTARNAAGYDQVVDVASAVNGWQWAYEVVVDPRVRWECFTDMLRRAHRMAAASFPRLHPHERTGAIDRLALDLITELRPLEGIGIRISSWDAWYVWCRLLPLRMYSAAGGRARDRRLLFVSLDEALALDGPAHGSIHSGAPGSDPDEGYCVQLAWHVAAHLLSERIPDLLSGCRAGGQIRRMATVCEAATWVLQRGADDSDARTMFTEDAVSAKLLAWRGLATVRPETWGRYGARAVPTREVIEKVAATVDPACCECTIGGTGALRRCWFHSVFSRLKDLNDRDRTLHLTLTMVMALLREGSESVGLRPGRGAGRSLARRPPARPEPLPQPGSEPCHAPLAKQLKLGYPPVLGYDSTALLRPGPGGTSLVPIDVVHSDEPGYPAAILAHRAATQAPEC